MKRLIALLLCTVTTASPAFALELRFETISVDPIIAVAETNQTVERVGIREKFAAVPEAVLDAGRVRKVVTFRGNKSARFAEFENLDLAPQQIFAKSLLNSAVAIDDRGVVNYAELPDENPMALAVEKVETKITPRAGNNPAIAGYGRTKGSVYDSLRLKRARDAKSEIALQEKLAQFQVKERRMQEKIARVDQISPSIN
jgi:hypothetical protein